MNNLRHALAEADDAPSEFDAGLNLGLVLKSITADPLDWPPGAEEIVRGWQRLRSWEFASGGSNPS